MTAKTVEIGLEILTRRPNHWVPGATRIGLLYNSSSLNSEFESSVEAIHRLFGPRLCTLFGPQHGVSVDVQDNMVETGHATSKKYNIPVWSLYSDVRKPRPEMLDGIDVLLVDLQDVGTRVYTFIWTLLLLMEACAKAGVKVIVLDRPNPLGGIEVEGNLLDPAFFSFVGMQAIPMRHGLTMGELALLFKDAAGLDCEVEVIRMEGWQRSMLWPETGRVWVNPSPNMPAFETSLVYPGAVLLEGANVSEGRGTTRPFELLGAPWINADLLASELNNLTGLTGLTGLNNRTGAKLPGVRFRPVEFLPTFQKWMGKPCGGVQIHPTDNRLFKPYRTGLEILRQLWKLFRDSGFDWNPPPYEYETEKLPINLLIGDERVRQGLEAGEDVVELEKLWKDDLAAWEDERKRFFLY